MTYATISQWTSKVSRESEAGKAMENMASEKYLPGLKALGAINAYFISTGDTTFNVVTIYPDEATASNAVAKQNEIRSQAASELSVNIVTEARGPCFASF